jgi:hypothetical protein
MAEGFSLYGSTLWKSGLWIRIDFMRIRIHNFFNLRIRIQGFDDQKLKFFIHFFDQKLRFTY